MEAPRLKHLIGQEVLAVILPIHQTELQEVRLLGVELGGIWIESEVMTQSVLRNIGAATGKTPLFFVPYAQIKFLMGVSEKIALSESSFGV
jgi:hypothetical protein